jgi:hypothetical protein
VDTALMDQDGRSALDYAKERAVSDEITSLLCKSVQLSCCPGA